MTFSDRKHPRRRHDDLSVARGILNGLALVGIGAFLGMLVWLVLGAP